MDPRWAPAGRRARRPTDLDGRQNRRLGGDAKAWQASGDPGALVQRAARDGRPGAAPRARWPRAPITTKLAERAQTNFAKLFWNSAAGCLYDVVNGDDRDASIRPNQILAVSLFHKMLIAGSGGRGGGDCPAPPADAVRTAYSGAFRSAIPGPLSGRPAKPRQRLSSRNGLAVAHGAVSEGVCRSQRALARGAANRPRNWLSDLSRFIEDEGAGQLPEVFDGDAPHRPGGCIAQAWSVSELLRTCVEDVYRPAPPKTVPKRAGAEA